MPYRICIVSHTSKHKYIYLIVNHTSKHKYIYFNQLIMVDTSMFQFISHTVSQSITILDRNLYLHLNDKTVCFWTDFVGLTRVVLAGLRGVANIAGGPKRIHFPQFLVDKFDHVAISKQCRRVIWLTAQREGHILAGTDLPVDSDTTLAVRKYGPTSIISW